ncbi:MAG: type IV pilus secretin PilQ [Candidatus Acidiferrales bacterium]
MRIIRQPWGFALLFAASLILIQGTLGAESGPVVRLDSRVQDGVVRLVAQATGPFEYTTSRPNRSLLVLDLSGVSAPETSAARTIDSSLVKGYRVLSYANGPKPVVRIEVRLNPNAEPTVVRDSPSQLTVVVAGSAAVAATSDTAAKNLAPPSVAPSAAGAAIEHVRLEQSGSDTQVSVTGNGPLSYHVLRLTNPDRVVLDFSGSHVKTAERTIASNLDPVREIRLAQFAPQVARVVIDLRESAPYTVNAKGNTVTVQFVAGSSSKGAAKPVPGADATPVTTTQVPAPPVVLSPAVVLPASLTQPSAALASASEPKIALASSTTAAANPSDITRPGATVAQAAATPAPAAKYSGEPISVNLKDVDLRDFFRLIHEISGLNIVLDPSVKGNLTIVLDDVPWDQALDIVLKNNDLEKQLDGNVLRIATQDTIKKEAEETRDLAKAQAESADIVTTTRVLSYAKSDDMVSTLKKFLSSRGDVISDPRSNTVIIRDIPSVLPVMDNLIRQLDRKSQQVEIEARVVAANRSFTRQLGTELAFSAGTASRNNVVGGDTTVGTSPISRPAPLPSPPLIVTGGGGNTSPSMPLSTSLSSVTPTSGISYLFSSRNFALDMVINAAENKGVGKLLSKPRVITQNNQKATVKQGVKIPVQTIVNNTISVQFVDAVLQLDVTPQITAEGTVFMDVKVTNDQIDPSIPRVEGIPAIDTQEEDTRVTITDGGTVVIGGIIVSNQQTSIDQVPILGSLPAIGNLFKHTTVSSSSSELLFFLTPRILPD